VVGSPARDSVLSVEGDEVRSPSRTNGTHSRHNSSQSLGLGHNHNTPLLFADSGWDKLNNTIISTSNCGNPSLRQFGFGPTSGDGFGIGYIIKEEGVSICASSKHRQTKRFVDALESYLIEIRRILRSTQKRRTSPKASRVREASMSRPKGAGTRLKSRGRAIRAMPAAKGTLTPQEEESGQASEDEGLGGYGFFDAGMLLQALKARDEGLGDGEKGGDKAVGGARRREIGKKLRLSEY